MLECRFGHSNQYTNECWSSIAHAPQSTNQWEGDFATSYWLSSTWCNCARPETETTGENHGYVGLNMLILTTPAVHYVSNQVNQEGVSVIYDWTILI